MSNAYSYYVNRLTFCFNAILAHTPNRYKMILNVIWRGTMGRNYGIMRWDRRGTMFGII